MKMKSLKEPKAIENALGEELSRNGSDGQVGQRKPRHCQPVKDLGPFCHVCNRHVKLAGDRCALCGRIVWEASANIPGPKSPKLRTTADTYRQLGNGNTQLPETDK
jgi:hypothetical protein